MQALTIQTKLGGFYFFYYAIVGTFMPYWSLYLQDQGFNYQEIGILSSIAIITRFFAPFIWGWVADKTGKRMLLIRIATWMEACIWFTIFLISKSLQSIALLMLIFSFFYLHLRLKVFAHPLAPLRVIFDSWRHMLKIGIPAMATNAIIPVSSGIVVAMIATYGVDAVAGFGVAMRIEPIFLIPFYALSAVTSPFFGQNISAGKYDRLLAARLALIRSCLGFGLLLAIVLITLARPLTGLFSESDPIQQVAVHYLRIVSISYGAYGIVMSVNAAFNGMGKPVPGLIISACRVIVLH